MKFARDDNIDLNHNHYLPTATDIRSPCSNPVSLEPITVAIRGIRTLLIRMDPEFSGFAFAW